MPAAPAFSLVACSILGREQPAVPSPLWSSPPPQCPLGAARQAETWGMHAPPEPCSRAGWGQAGMWGPGCFPCLYLYTANESHGALWVALLWLRCDLGLFCAGKWQIPLAASFLFLS